MEIYSWTTTLAEPGKEFNKKFVVLEGAVPKDLNGTIYCLMQ
jgi:hypothetical protein